MRINKLNFFNRRVDNVMPHFTTYSKWLSDYDIEKINKWIYENCTGRYCMVKDVKWDKDAWKGMTTIGFEQPSDMTLFALSGLMTDKPKY